MLLSAFCFYRFPPKYSVYNPLSCTLFPVYLRLAFDSIYRVKCKPLGNDGNNDHTASATKFSFVCTQAYDEIATNIRNDVCFLLQSTRQEEVEVEYLSNSL
jgi:hypothetical protein